MARSKKHEKNLAKVQSMIDGDYQQKLQVGQYNPTEKHREVGDKWTDAEGDKWEQKEGYKMKVSNTPSVGLFSKVCKDCGHNCTIGEQHYATWKRFNRCYYCQIDFEAMLATQRIGEKNNKWWFWVKLHELQRWVAADKESEAMIQEIMSSKINDRTLDNALAAANIEDARKAAQ